MNRPSSEALRRGWRLLWEFYQASLERRRKERAA
jgi:hypothetical protein